MLLMQTAHAFMTNTRWESEARMRTTEHLLGRLALYESRKPPKTPRLCTVCKQCNSLGLQEPRSHCSPISQRCDGSKTGAAAKANPRSL